jgi:hypothetical protein
MDELLSIRSLDALILKVQARELDPDERKKAGPEE